MTKYILPYRLNSAAAHDLSKALGIQRIRREATTPDITGATIINWGCPEQLDRIKSSTYVNDPKAVNQVANKKTFFEIVAEKFPEAIPLFTTSSKEALSLVQKGMTLVARTKLRSREGSGIVFLTESFDEWIEAPLYTQYIPKIAEFRVHVWRGEVLDVQKKVLRKEWPDGTPVDKSKVDFRIRNFKGGFIFQRNNIEVPPDVIKKSLQVMSCFKLDFGAVDVIFNEKQARAFVLEVNTAPGIEGTTLEKYVKVFAGL